MNDITRLAIIDRGEPVVRVLAAVGNLNRRGEARRLQTVVLTDHERDRAWFARDADELVTLPTGEVDAARVVRAVTEAGADGAWLGLVPCTDRAELVEQLAAAGVRVVGPSADTIRTLADPQRLAELGSRVGLEPLPDGQPHRIVEIDVLADAAGTVWTLGLRESSVTLHGHLVLAEMPAPGVPDTTAGAMEHAARRLVRAAAYTGAGVVRLALGPDGESFWLLDADTLARAEHALVEETTGASFVGLRLRLAAGGSLDATEPPDANGHALEVRLLALDPQRACAPSGGALEMLDLPVGTGVRVDASRREGDLVDGESDPVVATITAWGRDRDEAYDRARGALGRTTVVLERGATNRTSLLALLDRLAEESQPVPAGWLDAELAAGRLHSPADPLAVVAAAVEAYESDSSMVNAAFFASAARGRPEHPEAVGTHVQLSYRGSDYRLRVDRTGPRTYRVRGTATVEVTVDKVGAYERRMVCRGAQHRVVATEQGADFRLEIDGVGHLVSREDGVVVRTGWPALVSNLLVEAGQQVTAGQPVAVLESMKMVTTVTAPFDGTVTSLAVANNTQVERGAPLLRIRSTTDGADHPALAESSAEGGPDEPVDLASIAAENGTPAGKDAAWVYRRLCDYLLGYDLDPETFKALLKRQGELAAGSAPADIHLIAAENTLLDLFADIGALYRPRTEAEASGEDLASANTQEYFLAYLQWLDPDQAGLPERYRRRLERALARYGVRGLTRTRALEAATVWMFRSFERIPVVATAVLAVLNRRLTHHAELAPLANHEARERLDRLVTATEGRVQNVADLARDITFHFFEEPEMLAAADEAKAAVRANLALLRENPARPDRGALVDALVAAPHPLRGDLLEAWRSASADEAAYRDCVLEVYLRRFYRIRDLQDVGFEDAAGFRLGHADYDHEGMPVHLVVSYAALDELPALAQAIQGHLRGVSSDPEVVVDVVLWRDGTRGDIDELAEQARELLSHSDFGRVLHRLDLTVTSLGGSDDQGKSTQHLTFRQAEDESGAVGFVEDTLYRNLHPMLAKRMDLWRLANFELTRLPSPEDVYLFHGQARENPKDRRLFALAEVRDLVKVRDEQTGIETYPRLGRVGLQALAAMRSALSTYPPRERPTANRLVLWVRPTWEIPPSEWPALAANYLPLAKGAGLDKVALHVHAVEDDQLVDKVLTVDGIGRTGTTIRFGDPGPNPIRPLTRYAQKVLTAERFGTPYPYEIVQMLTPGPEDPSPFPRGTFQELELDADGENLVPTDRPPASNSAHLVVGLLTTYTDVVPEGMTRVAMLSDPTQGLGNLSEPECRRINASLKLAEIDLQREAAQEAPILLLDDVFSELDDGRQKQLLGALTGCQSLITCTEPPRLLRKKALGAALFPIEDGTIGGMDSASA
ncbi:MAG TPA: biotin carboxylase N-terminal domain-containing protein, partial [Dermatophilaceae bacterium]|nr:biotin carboxylase N-terminal domain-containing protein [Dermatophilaceae bacterium]